MKIYTKTGDRGTTQLLGGERVSKSHALVNAYGTLDELNSHLGFCISMMSTPEFEGLKQELEKVQHDLFTIGSHLACSDPSFASLLPQFSTERIHGLENWIDQMQSQLPELKNFILPGGHPAASAAHLARTVCRRAERELVCLQQDSFLTYLAFLNRLSDALFVVGRYSNHLANHADILWQKT